MFFNAGASICKGLPSDHPTHRLALNGGSPGCCKTAKCRSISRGAGFFYRGRETIQNRSQDPTVFNVFGWAERGELIIEKTKPRKLKDQAIGGDLFIPWLEDVGGRLTFEGVTWSCQKGHKELPGSWCFFTFWGTKQYSKPVNGIRGINSYPPFSFESYIPCLGGVVSPQLYWTRTDASGQDHPHLWLIF